MLKTWSIHLKHLSSIEYQYLREISRLSGAVYNSAIYNIRQHYFVDGTYLSYEANYWQMKDTPNYRMLGAQAAQQSMRVADYAFKSYFSVNRKVKLGEYSRKKLKLPNYVPTGSLCPVTYAATQRASVTGEFIVPVSRPLQKKYPDLSKKIVIKLPNYLIDKRIHQIKLIPKCGGRYFVCQVVFDDNIPPKIELNTSNALAIDFGVDNFATCVTSEGESFIIDGRKVKSINQWYNKENARLSSIKDHQKILSCTSKQRIVAYNRERKIQAFIYASTKYIVDYCLDRQIGNIVVGYNSGFQDKVNLGRVNNQIFARLPYGKFKSRLNYLCTLYGIIYTEQEESYTSKASFWDKDELPTWNPLSPKQGKFSGRRIKRGLYKTSDGKLLNADVNGALNILRKSNVVSLEGLYSRGATQVPVRIRLI